MLIFVMRKKMLAKTFTWVSLLNSQRFVLFVFDLVYFFFSRLSRTPVRVRNFFFLKAWHVPVPEYHFIHILTSRLSLFCDVDDRFVRMTLISQMRKLGLSTKSTANRPSRPASPNKCQRPRSESPHWIRLLEEVWRKQVGKRCRRFEGRARRLRPGAVPVPFCSAEPVSRTVGPGTWVPKARGPCAFTPSYWCFLINCFTCLALKIKLS